MEFQIIGNQLNISFSLRIKIILLNMLSLANRYANGNYLNPSEFGGGREANNFLKNLGFIIIEK